MGLRKVFGLEARREKDEWESKSTLAERRDYLLSQSVSELRTPECGQKLNLYMHAVVAQAMNADPSREWLIHPKEDADIFLPHLAVHHPVEAMHYTVSLMSFMEKTGAHAHAAQLASSALGLAERAGRVNSAMTSEILDTMINGNRDANPLIQKEQLVQQARGIRQTLQTSSPGAATRG